MANSFVLNLDRNLQNITAEDESTTVQEGELIIKGYSMHIPAGDTEEEYESFDIFLDIPVELFRYAANVMQVPAAKLTVYYNELEDPSKVTLEFIIDEGGSPK